MKYRYIGSKRLWYLAGIVCLGAFITVCWAISTANTVVIVPIFTKAAYSNHGFYDYYAGKCGQECLTLNVSESAKSEVNATAYSGNTLSFLNDLGYRNTITDIDVLQKPEVLSKYKTVVLLHSEYVTEDEYNLLAHHSGVIYLAPNALYAQVEYSINTDNITLIRGHDFNGASNAFGWQYDNTNVEKIPCSFEMPFRTIENDNKQLMCNPEIPLYFGAPLVQGVVLSEVIWKIL